MKTNSTNTKLKQLIESTPNLKEIKFVDNYILKHTKYIVENKPKQGEVNWTKDYIRSPFESVQHNPNLAIYTDNMWCVDIDYKIIDGDTDNNLSNTDEVIKLDKSKINKPYEILKILIAKNIPFVGQISTSGLHLFFKQPNNWEKFIFKPDPYKHFKKSVMSVLGYEYELLSPSKVTVKINRTFRKWFANFTGDFNLEDFNNGELPEIPEWLLPISGLKSVHFDKSPEMVGFLHSGFESIVTGNRHNTFFKIINLCKQVGVKDAKFVVDYINNHIVEKYDEKILYPMIQKAYDFETHQESENFGRYNLESLLEFTPLSVYDHLDAKKELDFIINLVSGLMSYDQIIELSKKSENIDLAELIFKDYDKLELKPSNYLVLESLSLLSSFYRLKSTNIKNKLTDNFQKNAAKMLLKVWESWLELKDEKSDEFGVKEFLEKVVK